jgi:hypothetical protein
MESDRNRVAFIQQVIQQSQPKLESTEVTAITTMDHAAPAVLLTACPQRDDPDGGSAGRPQPAREAQGLCQRRLMEMEATTFLV